MLHHQEMELFVDKIQKNRIELGNLIREARERKYYSQDGLAKLVEMERQQIYRIENAKSGTSKETGLKIAKVLDIEERKILGLIAGVETEPPNGFGHKYDNLPPKVKKLADKQINAILDSLADVDENDVDYI